MNFNYSTFYFFSKPLQIFCTLFTKMLSASRIRNACPKHYHLLITRSLTRHASSTRTSRLSSAHCLQSSTYILKAQPFTTSRCLSQEELVEPPKAPAEDIEKVVRDAKQRFRDTLPKDYLNEEEYALYVRLYGPPLRETEPEDVGIHMHHDMGTPAPAEGTLLKELDDGTVEEIIYEIPQEKSEDAEVAEEDPEQAEVKAYEKEEEELVIVEKAPSYVESVARSPREAEALQKLVQTFEEKEKSRKEAEDRLALQQAEEAHLEQLAESSWPPEDDYIYHREEERDPEDAEPGAPRRFHPYTIAGSFHDNPVELLLPRDQLVQPIADLLQRTHIDHVQKAAEAVFGGPGLPLSAEMVLGRKSGHMGGVGLLADQRHMTEIEADAFLAGFMPAAYASIFAALREVRKRVGGSWIQSRLEKGGPGLSVLDAGSGGAGLIAWEQVLRAEWELLKEKGKARGADPPSQKTVIATSDRLRNRLKTFLHDTTFLPRMPDYEHSGEMRGPRLEGGDQQQPRKSYDLIIASHLLLREKEDHRRQAILNNIWHLLKKDGGVLIILEKAHPRGFEAVAHARDTIINQFLLDQDGNPRVPAEDFNPAFHREPEPGHVIAPCTTQGTCPMYPEPGKYTGRKDYCHFSQRFVRPNFYNRLLNKKRDNQGEVEFSYVAVQRGVAKAGIRGDEATDLAKAGYENSKTQPEMQTLPRLVLPALKRKGHVTMDVCTPSGKIERWTVPKSFSKLAYHDARKSRWGDLWALGAKTRADRNVRNGRVDDGKEEKKPKTRKIDIDGDSNAVRVSGGSALERKGKGKMKKKNVLEELRKAEERDEEMLEREMDEEILAELEADEVVEREEREKGRS